MIGLFLENKIHIPIHITQIHMSLQANIHLKQFWEYIIFCF